MQDGKPVVLIECKRYGSNLEDDQMSQLLRYFTVTEARFAVLTDGIIYRFFSDLEEPNVMDPTPFFEFNMLDFTEAQVHELQRFTKPIFELGEVVDAARELKYTRAIKHVLADQLSEPSEDFVRFLLGRVYQGRATLTVRQQFGSIAKRAFAQFIHERINARLKSALEPDTDQVPQQRDVPARREKEPELAEAELEALEVIRTILVGMIDAGRVSMKVSPRYTTVHVDGKKVLCRLRLRGKALRLIMLDTDKREERVPLESIEDLGSHSERLRAVVRHHDPSAAFDLVSYKSQQSIA